MAEMVMAEGYDAVQVGEAMTNEAMTNEGTRKSQLGRTWGICPRNHAAQRGT